MRFELPGYDVNYRDGSGHNTPAGKKIAELNKFLRENGIEGGIACLDEKGQVVKRYTDRVVLEIDDSVSQEKLEKIKEMVSELLRIMGATETQVVDVFNDESADEERKILGLDGIITDLKKNHIKVERNFEVFGIKGRKISVNLPRKGSFEGFKFELFLPHANIIGEELEGNEDLTKNLFSMKDISSLLKSLNRYLEECGVVIDEDLNFSEDLQWRTSVGRYDCDTRKYLQKIVPMLNGSYWLKDEDVGGKRDTRAIWDCFGDMCSFNCEKKGQNDYYYGRSFLLKI